MAAQRGNKSQFHKTVILYEWWLIWAENENHDKKLAIAGHTSKGLGAMRVFSSSPILRRHDVFTLETTDGIYVSIYGLINKTRTEENGFPSEVFRCFFFGFPPCWEVCAENYLAQGSASKDVSREDFSLKGSTQTIEEYDTTNVGGNASPLSADPKLDKDLALCPIREGSQTVMYINETGGQKDPGWKKPADIEMESKLKENADIKEASKAEKKAQNNVSSEDANSKGCSNANTHINEMADTRANVCVTNSDSEVDQDHIACMILEGLKNSNETVKYITRAPGAKETAQRKTSDIKRESNLKENAINEEASAAEEKTCNNVISEDAVLNGCINASERTNEMNNIKANVTLANTNPELHQELTACMILKGSENSTEAFGYMTRACKAKDTDQRRTADIEMECIFNENAVIKEARIAEENTYNNVSIEDSILEGCSTASEKINERTNTEANVSIVNPDLVLDQDQAACMILEGPKNSNEAFRNITRARGAKDTNQRKTAAVEKESIVEEYTASKKASSDGIKTCTGPSLRFRETSKKSNKAVMCRTRSGGAEKTDWKKATTGKKKSSLIEKAGSKETSKPEANTKRKLTYGSPVTPKADVKTSFISPELSSMKRSRSGRLLLPVLEYWRNQTKIYDQDHQVVIGVTDGISTPSRAELTHEPKRSEGRSRNKNDHKAATEKLPHEPKKYVGRPKSINDPDAAVVTKKLTEKPKRSRGRPKGKNNPDAAKEEIKRSCRR
ncbi:hypothetical protein AgCh_003894 [Apium graveolens]